MKILRNLTLAVAFGALMAGTAQIAVSADAQTHGRNCRERCRLHATTQYEACLANGGTPERCAHNARAAYRRCVRVHCQ